MHADPLAVHIVARDQIIEGAQHVEHPRAQGAALHHVGVAAGAVFLVMRRAAAREGPALHRAHAARIEDEHPMSLTQQALDPRALRLAVVGAVFQQQHVGLGVRPGLGGVDESAGDTDVRLAEVPDLLHLVAIHFRLGDNARIDGPLPPRHVDTERLRDQLPQGFRLRRRRGPEPVQLCLAQVKQRLGVRILVHHLPVGGGVERLGRQRLRAAGDEVGFPFLEVLAQEVDGGLPQFRRVLVPRPGHRDIHPVLRAIQLVDALGPLDGLQGPLDGEEIIGHGADEHRLGRHAGEVVIMIGPVDEGAGDELLAVLRLAGEIVPAQRHYEGAGDGCGQALLRHHQEHALRPAAGVAGDGDALGIDFRARFQVVDGPHGVPDEVAGDAGAPQHVLHPRVGVLRGAAADDAPVVVRVPVLEAFALPGRVHRQHHKAVLGQVHAYGLVSGVAFAEVAVAADEEHRRRRLDDAVGQVERAGDIEVGQALVDELLDGVAVALDGAGDGGVHRRALRRQPANGLDEVFPHPSPVGLKLPYAGDLRLPLGQFAQEPFSPETGGVRDLVGHVVVTVEVGAKGEH